MRTLFLADWRDVVFMHFRVNARELQPHIPFELDLFDDAAFISLVAFTQKRLRPTFGGRVAAMLTAPFAEHEFLNARTYVRCGALRGIYFMSEWVPNRLAQLLGPATYGLPYRLGAISYEHGSTMRGRVVGSGLDFHYRASIAQNAVLESARQGSFDDFVLERYFAFTQRGTQRMRFEIRHDPWQWHRLRVDEFRLVESGALGRWAQIRNLCSAHASPGPVDVAISWPATCRVGTAPQIRCRSGRSGSRGCP